MISTTTINAMVRPRWRLTTTVGFGAPVDRPLVDAWEAGPEAWSVGPWPAGLEAGLDAGAAGRGVSECFCCSSIGSVR
jgi:hypothetical protein